MFVPDQLSTVMADTVNGLHAFKCYILNFYTLVEEQSIVMSMSVCLSLCLYARISQEPHLKTSPKFLSMLFMAWYSYSSVAVRYLLPFFVVCCCHSSLTALLCTVHTAHPTPQAVARY